MKTATKQIQHVEETIGEEPSLPHVGGPTQSQLSRPMSSRHHISMEHQLRRKDLRLNCDTNASNEMCLKDREEKKQKKKLLFCEKNKNGKKIQKINEKHESEVTFIWAIPDLLGHRGPKIEFSQNKVAM